MKSPARILLLLFLISCVVFSTSRAGWRENGVPLTSRWGTAGEMVVAPDGSSGAIIVWEDGGSGNYDVYAQRVNASGAVQWTADGNALCMETGIQEYPVIVSDGAEGAIVAWLDHRCGSLIYAGRVGDAATATTIPQIPLALYQNHPNPFNPRTVIRFYLPEAQEVSLNVYNIAGQRVARLAEGKRKKGYHEVAWHGRNSSGTACSSGVYFCRLTAGRITITRKMVIVR